MVKPKTKKQEKDTPGVLDEIIDNAFADLFVAEEDQPKTKENQPKTEKQKKGIFCLEEAGWFRGIKDTTTLEPVLRLLETGYFKVPFLHHDVGTREEFEFFLTKWKGKTFDRFPILYLGFHGKSGGIAVGEGRNRIVKLDELASYLKESCKGRVIIFGSCSTLDVHGRKLTTFRERTGALAVLGYKENVDWLEAAAFEMLVLGRLQEISFQDSRYMKIFDQKLKETASGLYKRLGFRMW